MKFKNISAQSYYFTPNIVTGPFHTELSLTKVFENCKIQFFGGTPPTNAVALNLTFADLDNPEKFTKILETEPFQVISSYDPDKRKRYISNKRWNYWENCNGKRYGFTNNTK